MANRMDDDLDGDEAASGSTAAAPRSGVSTKRAVEQLDDRERRFAFIAAGASLVFGVMIYVLETRNHNFRLSKGQLTPQTTLILGIAFAVLITAATLWGRRAPVGFVTLFAFLGFGTYSFVVGLPFLALAGWLLYRSFKIQKESATAARRVRAEASANGTAPARGTSARGAAGSARSTPKKGRAPAPKGPEANKRYTPKRPAPPPPPPPKLSRRQRKAAEAEAD